MSAIAISCRREMTFRARHGCLTKTSRGSRRFGSVRRRLLRTLDDGYFEGAGPHAVWDGRRDHEYVNSLRLQQDKFLDTSVLRLEWRDLGHIEIAPGIGSHVMERAEVPGRGTPLSKRIQERERLAVEDHDFGLAAVADIEKPLPGIR